MRMCSSDLKVGNEANVGWLSVWHLVSGHGILQWRWTDPHRKDAFCLQCTSLHRVACRVCPVCRNEMRKRGGYHLHHANPISGKGRDSGGSEEAGWRGREGRERCSVKCRRESRGEMVGREAQPSRLRPPFSRTGQPRVGWLGWMKLPPLGPACG